MSAPTTTSRVDLTPFQLDTLPEGHAGMIPPEVHAFEPVAELAATFEDLRDRFEATQQETYALIGELGSAGHADSHALKMATLASDPDPGEPALEALRDRVIAPRRQLDALADALRDARADLLDALHEHADAFRSTLDLDTTARRERVAELAAKVRAEVAGAVAPEAALRWWLLAIDPARSWSGVPSVNVPPPTVVIQGQEYVLENVLAGLVAAA